MKENLTPREGFHYPINRMAEAHDTPTGGSRPTTSASGRSPQRGESGREAQVSRAPPTQERIEGARQAWREATHGRELAPTESELAERGVFPVRGAANEAPPDRPFEERLDDVARQTTSNFFRPHIDRIRTLEGVPEQAWKSADDSLFASYDSEQKRIRAEVAVLEQQTPPPTRDINSRHQQLEALEQDYRLIHRLLTGEWADRFGRQDRDETPTELQPIADKLSRGEALTDQDRNTMNRWIDELDIASGSSPLGGVKVIIMEPRFSEKYLNKILSRPEGDPLKTYRLGWYESINLEQFLNRVREYDGQRAATGQIPVEESIRRFRNYSHESAMRESFHEMRKYMLEGNIRDLAQVARTIAPEYLQRAIEYTGVGTVNRLYDTVIKEILAQKQTIEPKDFEEIDRRVEARFRAMSKARLLGKELEEWEIRRALSVGGNYSVISLRVPELISVGRIPSLPFTPQALSKTFASFHYESVVRFLNPLRWLASRFGVGEVHGGQEYLKMVYEGIDESLHDPKKPEDIPKLEKILGLNRITFERSAPFLQTSFDSGWRTVEAYLNAFRVKTTVRDEIMTDPIDKEQYIIKVYDPNGREEEVEAGYYFNWQSWWGAQGDKARGFDIPGALQPLIDQVPYYRGIMIKDGPAAIRPQLWRSVAQDMPNQIMSLLSGDAEFEAIKQIYPQIDFNSLSAKLTLYQERRLQQQKDPDHLRNGIVTDIVRLDLDNEIEGFGIEDYEKDFIRDVIDLVSRNGGKAEELAKIKWPSNPIFEDNPYETADYMRTGAEVFRRRIGGDALALYGAMEELLPTISHPDMKFDTCIEHIEKAYGALDTPFGLQMAQDLMYPFIRARLRFTGEYDLGRRFPFIDDALSAFAVPLSRAQEYYGREGEALDAFALRQKIEQLVGKGIVRRHKVGDEKDSELTKLRREVHASLWDITKERLPIGLLLLLIFLTSQMVKSSLKEK